MSKAYICDKCGKIIDEATALKERNIHGIWTSDPRQFVADHAWEMVAFELCEECYAEFTGKYMANLKENGGEA